LLGGKSGAIAKGAMKMILRTRVKLSVASVCAVVAVGGGLLLAGLAAAAEKGVPPDKAAADVPKPEKDNSFALDTWMRRNKYPLSIKVFATDGKGGQNVPITLSVACGEGDYPAGKLCPVLAGKPVPAQVDVLATWPADKSIKHALVTVVLPELDAKEAAVVSFAAQAAPAPGKFVPAVDAKTFTASTKFTTSQGEETTSAVPAETMAKIADVLAGQITGEETKKLAPRMCGPVCYEFEVKVPATTGGASDKDIDVFYRLRLYSGVKGVRVEYDVENTRIPPMPYPNSFTATDRDFEKLVFRAGPADKPQTVYEQGAVTHWFATRYRICRWLGEKPLETYAKEGLPYLIYSEFFPKFDFEHPLTDAELETQTKRMTKAPWYREHAEFPDGVPLSNGPVKATMGAVAGRPEIGFYPEWARLALASDSPLMAHHARLWEGNALGAFPAHIRPTDNGQPGASGNHPMRQSLYDGKYHHVRSGKGCPNSTDTGHVPDAAYYTYLATGERFYEDEMSFWAAAMLHNDNAMRFHNRYVAWPVRNGTDAAFILPDGRPMKKYFTEMVQKTIDWQAKAVKDPIEYWKTGANALVCALSAPMWQECFNVWMLDNAARKGFPSAAAVRDAEAEIFYRLYENEDEFKAPNGKIYRWENRGDIIAYSTAISIRRLDFSDPKHVKDTFIKGITDNTGAMYYYTMVGWQYFGGDLAAKATKKVMEPEDWVLDPAFEKQFGERHTGYPTTENGLAPTIAALARYDNPRAQKLYEYIRDLMEKREPRRVRGTELVK
jgi:hypothetical protein